MSKNLVFFHKFFRFSVFFLLSKLSLNIVYVSEFLVRFLLNDFVVFLFRLVFFSVNNCQQVPHAHLLVFGIAFNLESSVHIVQHVVLTADTFDMIIFDFSGNCFASDGDLSLPWTIADCIDKVLL